MVEEVNKDNQHSDVEEPFEEELTQMSLFNKTSVMLSQASDDLTGRPNCSYCSAKRETVNGIESNLEYFTTSFVTNKLRSDDYEILMRRGFTRCGNYLYCRSVKKSCCEVYAYKVKLDDYQLSRNQKQALKRFHRYLETGTRNIQPQQKDLDQSKPSVCEESFKTKIKSKLEMLFADWIDDLDYEKHKVYTRGNQICSNILYVIKKQPDQDNISKICEQLSSISNCEVLIQNKFINVVLKEHLILTIPKQKKKPQVVTEQVAIQSQPHPNDYINYITPFIPEEYPVKQKVRYTIEIHRAVFTEEVFELYHKYELQVHGKETKPDDLKRHLCNSPVYDRRFEFERDNSKAPDSNYVLDDQRQFKDEGVNIQCHGSYFMYHRLDGKLVAVGCLDFLQQHLNSGYFIYDPDFKFLNLGVIGALREIEYAKMIRMQDKTRFEWYVLGDLVPVCKKVNYKLQYQPGYIVCPRTKRVVKYSEVQQQIEVISKMPIEQKRSQDSICLCGEGPSQTQEEFLYEYLVDKLNLFPILYNCDRWISIEVMTEKAKTIITDIGKCLMRETGIDFWQKVLLEIRLQQQQPKQPQQTDPNDSDKQDVTSEIQQDQNDAADVQVTQEEEKNNADSEMQQQADEVEVDQY